MSRLLAELVEYDGKHKDVLEHIRDTIESTTAILREAIALASHDEAAVAGGATWLLRAWIEQGAAFGVGLTRRLAVELPQITDHWARLHVCQAVRTMRVSAAQVEAFASFLEDCRGDRRPFLRAWAIDGLHHLGLSHAALAPMARRALEGGLDDAAASVRARVRRIMQGN